MVLLGLMGRVMGLMGNFPVFLDLHGDFPGLMVEIMGFLGLFCLLMGLYGNFQCLMG